jgi:hypothetical protein
VGETRLEIKRGLVECLSLAALDRDLRGAESALKQSKDMDQMLITRHVTRKLIVTRHKPLHTHCARHLLHADEQVPCRQDAARVSHVTHKHCSLLHGDAHKASAVAAAAAGVRGGRVRV